MKGYFKDCRDRNKEIRELNTENATDMSFMFSHYSSSIDSLDLSNFNTSKVTTMRCMFNDCDALEVLDLSSFDTSKVTDMAYMFADCYNLELLNLSSFDTNNVKDFDGIFNQDPYYISDVTKYDEEDFDSKEEYEEYLKDWNRLSCSAEIKVLLSDKADNLKQYIEENYPNIKIISQKEYEKEMEKRWLDWNNEVNMCDLQTEYENSGRW